MRAITPVIVRAKSLIGKVRLASFGRMPKIPTRLLRSCSYSVPIALILSASAFTFSTLVYDYEFTKKEVQGVKDIALTQSILTLLMESRGLEQFPLYLTANVEPKTHDTLDYKNQSHARVGDITTNNTGARIEDVLKKTHLRRLIS